MLESSDRYKEESGVFRGIVLDTGGIYVPPEEAIGMAKVTDGAEFAKVRASSTAVSDTFSIMQVIIQVFDSQQRNPTNSGI